MRRITSNDVVVIIDGRKYWPWKDPSLELTCTQFGGWVLWRKVGRGHATQLGGEFFDKRNFTILAAGQVVCGERPTTWLESGLTLVGKLAQSILKR